MQYQRIIDLSHPLSPGKEKRRMDVEMVNSDRIAGVIQRPGQWYIMHYINMVNHIGTHVEVPLHCMEDGLDLSSIPPDTFVGEAVILDLRGLSAGSAISAQQVQDAAAAVDGGIRKGDIVFANLGWSRHYGDDRYMHNPYFTAEPLQWLVDEGMKLLGADAMGIENPKDSERPAHMTIFRAGVPLIENLTGLDQLSKTRVFVSALPVVIEKLDAFPVRVVAME